ncbi:MAG: carboxylating nicotinate-nucleotide diphosphorylase [Deltaproteobacteria bacterium]|nr:MAG: carboxylating nicotinate-nucleotide diphosphorylase [Deltaproteobacteria bacterium]
MAVTAFDATELGWIDPIVDRVLEEDLARGDVTSRAVVPPVANARARLVAKAPCVVAGLPVFARVFERIDSQVRVEARVEDGTAVDAGTELAVVFGRARSILAGERSALNLLGRASGVATATRTFVEAAGGMVVADTRKTMPGLRALDRYAVRVGGGRNHRDDLGAAVLIKENHARIAGGVAAAVRAAKACVGHMTKVSCEVTNLDEVRAALEAGAEVLLLDNMTDDDVAEAVRIVAGRAVVEASGGLAPERLARLAAAGVNVASVGAITHSAPAADLSLLFDPPGDGP